MPFTAIPYTSNTYKMDKIELSVRAYNDLINTAAKRVFYENWYQKRHVQWLAHSGMKSPKAFHQFMGE